MRYITPSEAVLTQPPSFQKTETNQSDIITAVLQSAGIDCINCGTVNAPQLTTYYYNLVNVLDINKINRLINPLQAALNAPVRSVNTPHAHVAFEVPKHTPDIVHFKTALLTQSFAEASYSTALLGRDTINMNVTIDIEKAPHVLIAGATGAGKSVLLNTMITSQLFKTTPTWTRFIMIDVKQVELTKYDGIPHLVQPVITNPVQAVQALEMACNIMDKRYRAMRRKGIKKMERDKLIIVIDELADLMIKSKKEVENYIVRIAQLGRAAGIHLIIATQRPTVNIITGMIKANIPCRIALQTASTRDSMNILDHKGAEQLQGRGDALLKTSSAVREIRFQSAYIDENDIESVVQHWRQFRKKSIFDIFKRLVP